MAREVLEVVIDGSGAVQGGRVVQRELGQISGAAGSAQGALTGLRSSVLNLRSAMLALGGVLGVREILNVTVAFEGARNAMIAATGSAHLAREEMAYVARESDRLGLSLLDAQKQFAALAAASRGTALAGQATRDIFTAVAEASTVMSLSAEQTGGALTAIQQIISKGVVSAEELRGQLGERLPGAFQIAARAVGVTTQQLGKMLEQGALTAEELLPKLAVELRKTFGGGLENALDGTQAKLNRFSNSVTRLQLAFIESGAVDQFTDALVKLSDLISGPEFKEAIKFLGENLTLTLTALGGLAGLIAGGPAGGAVGALAGLAAGLALTRDKINELAEAEARLAKVRRGLENPDNAIARLSLLREEKQLVEKIAKFKEDIAKVSQTSAATGTTTTPPANTGPTAEQIKQFESLRRSLDAAYSAEQAYAAGQAIINANVAKGTELYERLHKLLNDRYNVALLEAAEAAKTTKGQVYSQVAALEDQYDALQKGERAFRVLTTAQKLQRQDLTLSPAVAMEYAEALVTAEEKLENFRKSQETAAEASKKAREEMAQQAKEDERLLQQPFLNAIDGIQGAFKDAFREILDGGVDSFKSFGDTILNIMKDVIAEIAALMVFRPVVGGVLNSLGGGGIAQQLGIPSGGSIFGSGSSIGGNTGAAGGTSGGFAAANQGQYGYTFGGVAGGALAGAGIGYGVGSVGGLNTTGSTIGGTVGGAVGSFWGPVGTVIGSVAGSIIGGVIGDAFTKQRDQQFSIATAARGSQGALDATGHYLFEGNRTRRSPFGTIGLLNADTSGTKGKTDEAILDTVLAFDEAIAQVLDIRQQQTIARFLQAARDGTTQHATSLGEGDIGAALKDRLLQMAEGLIGRPLQGLADQLAQINNKDLSKIQSEGARLIDLIALFADGFERGIRAITGGLNPLEQQIFNLEEEAAAAAKAISDNITKIREAVDLLRPNVPNQDDFTKVVERTVTETHGQGDSRYTVTRVIREIVPDVEAFRKAMEEARPGIEEFNKEFRQSEKAIKQMVLAAIGLGKDADVKELQGAALALKELMIRMREMKPVLIEAGFTAEEAAAKIEKAIKKAKRELRNDFNDSIDQQILQITNPFQAAMNDLIELQKQRIQDAKRLGGDLQDVYRLNHLERLELEKQYANQSLSQLKDFITELKTGDLSILSQRGQARVAGQNFNRIARQALNGDLDVGEFSSAARAYLEEQRALYGSGAGYRDAYNNVLSIAEKLGVNLNEDANDRRTNELRTDIKNQAELDRQNRNENFARQIDEMRKTQKTNDAILEAIVDLSRRLSEQGQEDVA